MRSIEGVVDVKDIAVGRRHVRRELIDQSLGNTRRICLRRRILEAADGRLRGKRGASLRAAADGHLQRRIIAQPVEIVAVLVTAGDGQNARADEFEHGVAHARRVAAIPHGIGQPRAHADLLLGAAQQQQPRIGRLVAAVEIDCEILTRHGWQIEGKRRSVRHGCGARWLNAARRLHTELLRDFRALRHSQTRFAQV